MGIPSFLALLIKAGAITKENGSPDPRMIRYETSMYPKDVGIELVVTDLEDLRTAAKLAEPRLAPWLEELCINRDLGLATKNAENAALLDRLQADREHYSLQNKARIEPLDEINYNKDPTYDANKSY